MIKAADVQFVSLVSAHGTCFNLSSLNARPTHVPAEETQSLVFKLVSCRNFVFITNREAQWLSCFRLHATETPERYLLADPLNAEIYCAAPLVPELMKRVDVGPWEMFAIRASLHNGEPEYCLKMLLECLATTLNTIGGRAYAAIEWLSQNAIDLKALRVLPAILRMFNTTQLEAFTRQLLSAKTLVSVYATCCGEDIWAQQALPALHCWLNSRSGEKMDLDSFAMNQLAHAGLDGRYHSISHRITSIARGQTTPNRKLCMLATCRNEGAYLLDWLSYHKSLGVEAFYIYSNDNDDRSDELLRKLEHSGAIKWNKQTAIEGTSPQYKAYGHALQVEPEILDFEWVAVLDVDEYIGLDLKRFNGLQEYIDWQTYQVTDAISLCWLNYGSLERGRIADPVYDRFISRPSHVDRHVKSIFRTKAFIHSHAHFPIWDNFSSPSLRGSDGRKHSVGRDNNISAYSAHPRGDLAWINHYVIKSASEFLLRRSAPRADHPYTNKGVAGVFTSAYVEWFQTYANLQNPTEDTRVAEIASERQASSFKADLLELPGVRATLREIQAENLQRLNGLVDSLADLPAYKALGSPEAWFLNKLRGD